MKGAITVFGWVALFEQLLELRVGQGAVGVRFSAQAREYHYLPKLLDLHTVVATREATAQAHVPTTWLEASPDARRVLTSPVMPLLRHWHATTQALSWHYASTVMPLLKH